MVKKTFIFIFYLIFAEVSYSQSDVNNFLKPSDTLNVSRRNLVVISGATLGTGSLLALNQLWYNDFDRSEFHTINDGNEWLQMDKAGHVFSAYQLSRLSAEALNWSGVGKKNQLIYGPALGYAFLTTVEIFDGFSEEWGFSWSDVMANTLGTGLYIGQELLWNEQRIDVKYSFHQTRYADQRPEKLGENLLQQMLKDYNGQTYWLSLNIRSFLKESRVPSWLNLAFGYGASGMLTGDKDIDNQVYTEQNRIRQYYLSLDLDLTRIKTNSHFLRTVFSVLNVLKFPLPTLEYNSEKKAVFRLLFY